MGASGKNSFWIHKGLALLTGTILMAAFALPMGASNADPTTFTLTFSINTGTSGTLPPSATYHDGDTVNIDAHNIGNLGGPGLTFFGWAGDNNGAAISFGDPSLYPSPVTSFVIHSNVTLLAQFTMNRYVVYDNNGGVGSHAPDYIPYNWPPYYVTLPNGTGFTKSGYLFAGWTKVANDASTLITSYGQSDLLNAPVQVNMTVHALWNVAPLCPALVPTFATPVSTGTGFTVVVTNYNNAYTFTRTATPPGSIVNASYSGSNLHVSVSGLAPGQMGTLTISVSKIGCATGSASVSKAAAPPYSSWTSTAAVHNWTSVASSADGKKLVAGGIGIPLFTSNDSGIYWHARDISRPWNAVASSANGDKLVAATSDGQIFTSIDSGVNWILRNYPGYSPTTIWRGLASSSNGQKLVAVGSAGIYTSINSGQSWVQHQGAANWTAVSSSSDGTQLAAAQSGGFIYASSNSGVNWTQQTLSGSKNWMGIASSSDGAKLVAVVAGGRVYTRATLSASWIPRGPSTPVNWMSVASSSDGSQLVAVVMGGPIYVSSDTGVNWGAHNLSETHWRGVALSSDGLKVVAVSNGHIYLSP